MIGFPHGYRLFRGLPDVPFRDHAWARFLRENVMEVFKVKERVKAK